MRYTAAVLLCLSLACPLAALAEDLFDLSLEEALEVNVSSVSRKNQRVGDSAAAVYVITQEDIRRSAASSVPEVLRLAPGLHVAQVDAYQWAISSRGFNGVYADNMLVLMDGRAAYNPVSSGVWWDGAVDVLLEDIERIEVIRGPGAVMWGANAVNGVINIITKSSSETQQNLVQGAAGNQKYQSGLRYSGKLGGATTYRTWGKAVYDQDNEIRNSRHDADDRYKSARVGWRSDTQLSDSDVLTTDGQIVGNNRGSTLLLPTFEAPYAERSREERKLFGGFAMATWNRILSEDSGLKLQTYYNGLNREEIIGSYDQHIVDVDFQHNFTPFDRHAVIWGGNVRHHWNSFEENVPSVRLIPEDRNWSLYTAFIQDDVSLIDNTLRAILGVKIEDNHLASFQTMPSAKLLYTPVETLTLWGSVARAVRAPALFNHDGFLILATMPTESELPGAVTLTGSSEQDVTDSVTYELGIRNQLTQDFYIDLVGYYTDYNGIQNSEPGEPFFNPSPVPHIEIPFFNANFGEAHSRGIELAMEYRPFKFWRLAAHYSFNQLDMGYKPGSLDPGLIDYEGKSVQNIAMLRSHFNLSDSVELDGLLRYADNLRLQEVDSYIELDARLAWRATDKLQLELIGKNLLDDANFEFPLDFTPAVPVEIRRSFFLRATLVF